MESLLDKPPNEPATVVLKEDIDDDLFIVFEFLGKQNLEGFNTEMKLFNVEETETDLFNVEETKTELSNLVERDLVHPVDPSLVPPNIISDCECKCMKCAYCLKISRKIRRVSKHKCYFCSEKGTWNNLKNHILTHTGEKSFDYSTRLTEKFSINLRSGRIYAIEKNQWCEACRKSFCSPSSLRRHLNSDIHKIQANSH